MKTAFMKYRPQEIAVTSVSTCSSDIPASQVINHVVALQSRTGSKQT